MTYSVCLGETTKTCPLLLKNFVLLFSELSNILTNLNKVCSKALPYLHEMIILRLASYYKLLNKHFKKKGPEIKLYVVSLIESHWSGPGSQVLVYKRLCLPTIQPLSSANDFKNPRLIPSPRF